MVPAQLDRIASVRIYQSGQWMLPGETPTSVAQALASLKPSWLQSLMRYPKNMKPRPIEVRAWNTVTQGVLAANPDTQFGIELNALQYRKPSQVVRTMNMLRASFHPDGWMMDFFTPAYRQFPKAVEAAIDNAHANNEFLGGNAFGITAGPKVPPGADFLAVQDFDFKIDLNAVKRLAQKITVTYHLGNNPQLANSDGCKFIQDFSNAQRTAFIRKRAGQQQAFDFRMEYPVLFPECERNRSSSNPDLFSYNAIQDGTMMQTIGQLMDQYENTPTAPAPSD